MVASETSCPTAGVAGRARCLGRDHAYTVAGLFGWRDSDTHGRVRDIVPYRRLRRFRCLIFQESDRILMNTEQCLEAQAQSWIVATGIFEISRALADG